ncbi:MAG: hypothetical protein CL872_05160 [Dehalococcoidaceae bacterium]|nr:hypothetical protein [Dehalococcoidaceae bacterium]
MTELKNFNIILINLDGLRQDRVELIPSLNKLKQNSYYFPEMKTVAPYTFASLHSIFSGMYPSRHGVNGYYNIFKFKDSITTITQLLKKSGYYTSCDLIDESVIPKNGFDEINIFDEKTVNFSERHEEIIKKLSEKQKFFLFLHYTEIHKHLVDAVIQKYDQESIDDDYFSSQDENNQRLNSYLPYCDNYVSTLQKVLEETNIADKTILIFFSDHGTSIGEKNGEKFYGVYVYDYTLKVFCMISIPKISSKTLTNQCRTIDIFPTIAEIIGQNIDHSSVKIQGESLFSLINNPNLDDREVFVETGGLYGPWPSPTKHNVFCVRSNNKKLIYNDVPETWEFYDLKNDPDELDNIYSENSEEIIFFRQRLIHYLNENEINTKLN